MSMILIQAIAVLAYIFETFMYQAKTKRVMLILQFTMCFVFFMHYFLLGPSTYDAAFINIVAMLRAFVFSNRDSWAKSKVWLIMFIIAFIAMAILNWRSIIGIFLIIGITMSTVALWVRDIKSSRKIFLVSGASWFIYNMLVGSIAMLGELVGLVSIIIAMCRYDIDFSKYKKIFHPVHK